MSILSHDKGQRGQNLGQLNSFFWCRKSDSITVSQAALSHPGIQEWISSPGTLLPVCCMLMGLQFQVLCKLKEGLMS